MDDFGNRTLPHPRTESPSVIRALSQFVLTTLLLFLPLLLVSAQPPGETPDESGFTTLFNGNDLSGWKHAGNWKVEEGVITRSGKGGSLVYQTMPIPDDFDLRFEWKVAAGSNSGLYYRPGQYEYQILDNSKHPDGKNPRTSAASLYFGVSPSHDATKPVGEWNSGRVVCKGTVIQHWLNGKKVIGFDYTDPAYAEDVERLKQRGGDVTARGARLSLQDHGDPVWYRNIRLKKLGPNDTLDRSKVTPQKLTEEQAKAEQEKLDRILRNRQK